MREREERDVVELGINRNPVVDFRQRTVTKDTPENSPVPLMGPPGVPTVAPGVGALTDPVPAPGVGAPGVAAPTVPGVGADGVGAPTVVPGVGAPG